MSGWFVVGTTLDGRERTFLSNAGSGVTDPEPCTFSALQRFTSEREARAEVSSRRLLGQRFPFVLLRLDNHEWVDWLNTGKGGIEL